MSAGKVIVQISDTHLLARGLLNDQVDPLANLTRIFGRLEHAGDDPDALVLSGDLADRGEAEAYRKLRDLVESYAMPRGVAVVYLPGNHDRRAAFRRHLLGWEANEESIDQVLRVGGLRLVALDSTMPGRTHGELGRVQLDWLGAELAEPAPEGTILALHHPPIPGPIALMNEIGLREPGRLGAVIAGTDVKLVLAGHAHHASAGQLVGVPVWVATSAAYQLDVLAGAAGQMRGVPGSAFTRVDLAGGTVVATNVPMMAEEEQALYEVDFDTLRRVIAREGRPVPPDPRGRRPAGGGASLR